MKRLRSASAISGFLLGKAGRELAAGGLHDVADAVEGRPHLALGNLEDAVFGLIQSYLHALALRPEDRLLFVADGAVWIWNRVPRLIKALGLDPQQVHELVDFYHAVEHLGKVAGLRKNWSAKQRQAWVKKHRCLLLTGHVNHVIEAVRELCRGRNSKAIRTERDYFVKNQSRMGYSRLKANSWPIGSGAVESAIRRIINLRLKGPGIFWYRENAEAMLMLRAYYKAGRWNLILDVRVSICLYS